MFHTFGHTIELMKMSWRVLMLDRELLLFPLMAGVMLALMAGIGVLTGSIDAVANEREQAGGGDLAVAVVLAFCSSTIVIFFNAALVAAAMERLRGGDPDVVSGLRAATERLPQILAWALITAVVTVILRALRERGGIGGAIASAIGGMAWDFATFLVVPVLVAEGVGPFAAIRRSASLLRQTWGRQVAASFGFTIVMLIAGGAALLIAVLLFLVHPVLGIGIGVPLVALAIGVVAALEGIFRAALYDYAIGQTPHGFDSVTLQGAWQPSAGGLR